MQCTSNLLMIRPVDFKFNDQTAKNNKFQVNKTESNVQESALLEFDNFVNTLCNNGINVTVIDDTKSPETPDSIFPNNWISFHDDGSIYLYPMFSENRRSERRTDIIDDLKVKFKVNQLVDLSSYELKNEFLEGTGSMVLDRENKISYACISERTHKNVLKRFAKESGYKVVSFNATDEYDFPIYHTNVMMCVADKYVVICLDTIKDEKERNKVSQSIIKSGKEIIEISTKQMNRFAGNMLQVQNMNKEKILVMSEQAYLSLNSSQINILHNYNRIVYAPIYTIEKNGGGSARCMLAEIHLEKK